MSHSFKGCIARYNKVSVIALLGGMHLLPENHSRQFRLDEATTEACSVVSLGNKTTTGPALVGLLNRYFDGSSSLANQEDPNDNLFTENIMFDGGNYVVYPGLDEGGAYVLQSLINALFKASHRGLKELAHDCKPAVSALLVLSKRIARKLNHSRNQLGNSVPEGLFGPVGAARGEKLAKSVTFPQDEVEFLLNAFSLPAGSLSPFFIDVKDSDKKHGDYGEGPLAFRPLYKGSDCIVAAAPTSFCFAIRSYIWEEARKRGLDNVLIKSLAEAQFGDIHRVLIAQNYKPFSTEAHSTEDSLIREIIYQIDVDKLVVFLVCPILKMIEDEDIDRKLKEVSGSYSGRYKMLVVVLPVTNGLIPFSMGLEDNPDLWLVITPIWGLLLCLEAHHANNSLSLWKYARLKEKKRVEVNMVSSSLADEFSLYLKHGKSFYVGDDQRFSLIWAASDCKIGLLDATKVVPDKHLVFKKSENCYREVRRISKDKIPIYVTRPRTGLTEHWVELEGVGVWVVHSESQLEKKEIIYSSWDFVDCVSYWTWQILQECSFLRSSSVKTLEIVIRLSDCAAQGETMQTGAIRSFKCIFGEIEVHSWFVFNGSQWILYFSNNFTAAVLQNNNCFDRLVVDVLSALFWTAIKDPSPDTGIPGVLKEQMSVLTSDEDRKKMFALSNENELGVVPNNLVLPRYVDDHDCEEQLDDLAVHLAKLGYTPRKIEVREEQKILTWAVVSFFIEKAREIVKDFDPGATIIRLFSICECIVRDQLVELQSRKYTQACYGDRPVFLQTTVEATQVHTRTALSLRTVIELIATCPGNGSRSSTDEEIDSLLSIGHMVVKWARISEEISSGLVTHELAILKSGRIGINHKKATEGHNMFFQAKFDEETSLLSQPGEICYEDEELLGLFGSEVGRKAFLEEFGATLDNLMLFFDLLFHLAIAEPNSIAKFSIEEFCSLVCSKLAGFDKSLVSKILNSFTLEALLEPDYPPEGYEKSDLYPWRYNRQLSLMRRPIVKLKNSDIVFGARFTQRSFKRVFAAMIGGEYRARGAAMRSLMGTVNNVRGKRFNRVCFDWLKANSSFEAYTNITIRPGGHFESEKDFGDIDILLLDRDAKRLYSLECKDVNFARESYQISNEWKKIETGDKAWTIKHSRRNVFLKSVVENDGRFKFGNIKGYQILSMIITSEVIPTPYLKEISLPVIPLTVLKRDGVKVLERNLTTLR